MACVVIMQHGVMGDDRSESRCRGRTRREVLALARRRGVIGPSDLRELGLHRMVLTRLTDEGLLERVGRGLYRLAGAEPLGSPDLVLVAARVSRAILGLVTALNHYGLTGEIPRAIDVLLPRGQSRPSIDHPPLRLFWASGDSYSKGVVKTELDGVPVRITSAAKTVADCFKFRRRVGLDVALEGLREGLGQGRFTAAEFGSAARIDRVFGVARPYLESLA